MKKVLLITDFSKPWNNGWYYKKGFERNNCEVLSINPQDVKGKYDVVFKAIEKFKPDFILHTKDELPVEIFEEARQKVPLIQWYPDPVIPDWLIPYVKSCDIFFTMAEGLVEEFRKINPKSFWLTQAFEPEFFEISDITEKDRIFFSSDVTFVGNLGSKKQYLLRRKYLKRVIKEGINLKWWGPKIPLKLSTIPLLTGGIGRSYGGRFVWGEEYAKVAKLSKIFLAFDSMPHIRKSMSARMYTAVGCGAFYMCQYVDGIEEILAPDKEIVTFIDEEEMIDKIRYYIQSDGLRNEISQRGRERVLKDHTYEIRMKELLSHVNKTI